MLSGNGGVIQDIHDPTSSFTGVQGEAYTLRWQHFNDCSTSSDEIVLTFSESASGEPSANGLYYIPDEVFRIFLQVYYPYSMEGDSLLIQNAHIIKELDLNNTLITNIDGIQFMSELERLTCPSAIKSLFGLSENLRYLNCKATLSVIPKFPNSLDTLIGYSWDINSLPQLPLNLKHLDLRGFQRLQYFEQLPENLEYIHMENINNDFGLSNYPNPIKIPEKAKIFTYKHVGNADSFPILPKITDNLLSLELSGGFSTMPHLCEFYLLTNLLIKAPIHKLPLLPPSLESLEAPSSVICISNVPDGLYFDLNSFPRCPSRSECDEPIPQNGKYYIKDSNFRTYLYETYPHAIRNDSLVIQNVSNINSISLYNKEITNIDGIQYFENLIDLTIKQCNSLSALMQLPNNLKSLEIEKCTNLTIITELPKNLISIKLQNLQSLTFVPDLPSNLEIVRWSNIGIYNPEHDCNTINHNFKIPEMAKEYDISDKICVPHFPTLPNNTESLNWIVINSCHFTSTPTLNEYTNLQVLFLYGDSLRYVDSLPPNIASIYLSGSSELCVINKPESISQSLSNIPICSE